jgi:hypothetical protein
MVLILLTRTRMGSWTGVGVMVFDHPMIRTLSFPHISLVATLKRIFVCAGGSPCDRFPWFRV